MGSAQLSAQAARGRPPRPRAAALARFWIGIVALFVTAATATLVAIAVVPAALTTWTATVVGSGSMEPALRRGDVVVLSPAGGEPLDAPAVVLIEQPGDAAPLLHRIVERTAQGDYVTRGDANAVADSSPAPPERILGVGTLLVPFVGYPLVWLEAGDLGAVLAAVVAAAGALWLARYGWDRRYDPWAGPKDPPRPPRPSPRRRRIARLGSGKARHAMVATALVMALGAAGTAQPLSSAAFTAQTDNSGSNLTSDQLAPASGLTVTTTCATAPAVTILGANQGVPTAGGSNLSLRVPSDVRAGDLLVAYVVTSTSSDAVPEGWARVKPPTAGAGRYTTIAQRVATAEDVGRTFRWTSDGIGRLFALRNAQPLRAGDAVAVSFADSRNFITAPSLPGADRGMLLAFFTVAAAAATILTPPDNMTVMPTGTSNGISTFGAYRSPTSAGHTGQVSVTLNRAGPVIGEAVIVRPAVLATHTLTWQASPSTSATGYEVRRDGAVVAAPSPRTATSWAETMTATPVPPSYQVSARAGSWRSAPVTGAAPGCP